MLPGDAKDGVHPRGRGCRLLGAPDELPGRDREAGLREKLLRLPLGEDRLAPPAARERVRPAMLDLDRGLDPARRPRLADVGRRLDGREPLLDPREGRDPAREEVLGERLRERLGERRARTRARPSGGARPRRRRR